MNTDKASTGRLAAAIGLLATPFAVADPPPPPGPSSYALTIEASVPTGVGPVDIAVGTLNADAIPDLAVANAGSGNVTVMLSDGVGGFQVATLDVEGTPTGLTIADYTGLPFAGPSLGDIVVANGATPIQFYANTGTGATYETQGTEWFVATGANQIAFVGDSIATITGGFTTSNELRTRKCGGGDGGGTCPGNDVEYDFGDDARSFATGDFDGDGKEDLAIANAGTGDVTILLFDLSVPVWGICWKGIDLSVVNPDAQCPGNGVDPPDLTGFGAPVAVAVGDLDWDPTQGAPTGFLDLVVLDAATNEARIFAGDGTGGFTPFATVDLPGTPTAVATGDLDQDGLTDIVVGGTAAGNGWAAVFRHLTGGSYELAAAATFAVTPTDIEVAPFLAGDRPLAAVTEAGMVSVVLFKLDLALAPCPADLNRNGAVGFGDLSHLLNAWGTCPAPCIWDLQGGGSVGFGDLSELLAAWGPCS